MNMPKNGHDMPKGMDMSQGMEMGEHTAHAGAEE